MSSHRVRRVELELEGEGLARMSQLRDGLRELYRRRLLPVLARAFDAFDPSRELVRLDSLELELGEIDLGNFEADYLDKFERALSTALRRAEARAAEGSSGRADGDSGDELVQERELLAQFLTTGTLPWWASAGDRGIALRALRAALGSPAVVVKLFATIEPSADSVARLVELVDELSEAALLVILRSALEGRAPAGVADRCALRDGRRKGDANGPHASRVRARASVANAVGLAHRGREGTRLRGWSDSLTREFARARAGRGTQATPDATSFDARARGSASAPGSRGSGPLRAGPGAAPSLDPSELPGRAGELARVDEDTGRGARPRGPGAVRSRAAGRGSRVAGASELASRASGTREVGGPPLRGLGAARARGGMGANQVRGAQRLARGLLDSPRSSGLVRSFVAPLVDASAPERGSSSVSARPHTSPSSSSQIDELHVGDAGLILAWPFLARLFERVELVQDGGFVDELARWQAVDLLHYVGHGVSDPPEHQLVLAKILCGGEPSARPRARPPLDDAALREAERMLEALVDHVDAGPSMTSARLRASVLLRPGILSTRDARWLLRVERHPSDSIIDRLPWTWTWIGLPWMAAPLRVEW